MPTGEEEAAGGRKEEQHLETGRSEPGWSGEDRATATPGKGASSERKRGEGQDVVGQMGRGEGSCTQLGLQWRGAGWVGRDSRGRVRV